MFKKNKFKKSGFTLIELLMVVSIIALLTSIVLSALATAKAKARDTARIQTLKQYANAIEIFYTKFGGYPGCSCAGDTGCGWVCTTENGSRSLVRLGDIYFLSTGDIDGTCTDGICDTIVPNYISSSPQISGSDIYPYKYVHAKFNGTLTDTGAGNYDIGGDNISSGDDYFMYTKLEVIPGNVAGYNSNVYVVYSQ